MSVVWFADGQDEAARRCFSYPTLANQPTLVAPELEETKAQFKKGF